MNEKYNKLNEAARLALKQVGVLPIAKYSFAILCEWLKIQDEEKQSFREALRQLVNFQFIQVYEDLYECSDEVQRFIILEIKPNVAECSKLIDTFIWKLVDNRHEIENPITKKENLIIAEFISKSVNGRNKEYANLLNNISLGNHQLGNIKRAKAFLETAIKILEEIDTSEPWRLASPYNNMAEVNRLMGDVESSLKYNLLSNRIHLENFLKFNVEEHATTNHNTALSYYALNKFEEAEKHEQIALSFLELYSKANNIIHPRIPSSFDLLAQIHAAKKDYAKSIELEIAAIKLAEILYPPEHYILGTFYNNLSNLYLPPDDFEQMDREKSIEIRKKAIEILEKAIGINHPELGIIYANHAYNYTLLNDFYNSNIYIEKAKVILKAYLPPEHPQFAALESIAMSNSFGLVAELSHRAWGKEKPDWDEELRKEIRKNE